MKKLKQTVPTVPQRLSIIEDQLYDINDRLAYSSRQKNKISIPDIVLIVVYIVIMICIIIQAAKRR